MAKFCGASKTPLCGLVVELLSSGKSLLRNPSGNIPEKHTETCNCKKGLPGDDHNADSTPSDTDRAGDIIASKIKIDSQD